MSLCVTILPAAGLDICVRTLVGGRWRLVVPTSLQKMTLKMRLKTRLEKDLCAAVCHFLPALANPKAERRTKAKGSRHKAKKRWGRLPNAGEKGRE